MKSPKWFLAALVSFAGLPVLAQQADAHVQQGASASAAGASVQESGAASASASVPMQLVNGELVGKLDSKTAKVGDAVILKTTASARSAAGVVIPKGSRLVGHVTDVRARAKGTEDGFVAVAFDRAELKGGQTLAVRSVIQSIAPSPASASSMESEDSLAGVGAGGGMRGGGRGIGGLGGGALSGSSSLAGSTTGALGATAAGNESGLTSAAGGALHETGNLSSTTAGSLNTTGSAAAHATAIPGVMLASDATGSTSGSISASRRNVHLDSGTQIVLGLDGSVNR